MKDKKKIIKIYLSVLLTLSISLTLPSSIFASREIQFIDAIVMIKPGINLDLSNVNYKYRWEDINGFALKIDKETAHKLIIDIDSFLFEIHASVELIKELTKKVYDILGRKVNDINKELMELLLKNGLEKKWFILLDSGRNFFTHNGTPFFAIDYTNSSNRNYDILIMKENLKSFDDDKKFYRLSEFDIIVDGFAKSRKIILEHIKSLCNNRN